MGISFDARECLQTVTYVPRLNCYLCIQTVPTRKLTARRCPTPIARRYALGAVQARVIGRSPNWRCGPQVFMILLPALRFLMRPRPPGDLAARRLAAVIRPPLLFFIVATPFCRPQAGHAIRVAGARARLFANSHRRSGELRTLEWPIRNRYRHAA